MRRFSRACRVLFFTQQYLLAVYDIYNWNRDIHSTIKLLK